MEALHLAPSKGITKFHLSEVYLFVGIHLGTYSWGGKDTIYVDQGLQ